jgi:hypothetical protein
MGLVRQKFPSVAIVYETPINSLSHAPVIRMFLSVFGSSSSVGRRRRGWVFYSSDHLEAWWLVLMAG